MGDQETRTTHKLDLVLAEVRLLGERLEALAQQLKGNQRKAAKRGRSNRQRAANNQFAEYQPTELRIARARKALRR